MFPHNSSSHEISTETNAFVQNSMGDVVVLGKNSPIGVGKGRESENARYCDIEFINNNTMVKPINHLKNIAANDFLTVLSGQTGKSTLISRSPTCQSVASLTTKHPTRNYLLTYDNNNSSNINNNNNNNINNNNSTNNKNNNDTVKNRSTRAEHNHQDDRKTTTVNATRKRKESGSPGKGELGSSSANNSKSISKTNKNNNDTVKKRSNRAEHNHQDDRKTTTRTTTTRKVNATRKRKEESGSPGKGEPGSSANNSKSISKTLSDNKTSFSVLNIRVLNISIYLRLTGDKCAIGEGVPSLVRIPKSDRPSSGHFSLDSLDNYSLLGCCLHPGKYNNVKSNSSLLSNNNDNYKSVILLSSTNNHYFLRVEMDGGAIAMRLRAHWNSNMNCIETTSIEETCKEISKSPLNFVIPKKVKISDRSSNEESDLMIKEGDKVATSSSITLIVPGNELTDQPPRPLPLRNAPKRAQSSPPWLDLVASELTQRACVPLSLDCKLYVVNKLRCKVICDVSIMRKGIPSHETSYETKTKTTHLSVEQPLSISSMLNGKKLAFPVFPEFSGYSGPYVRDGTEFVKALSKSTIGNRCSLEMENDENVLNSNSSNRKRHLIDRARNLIAAAFTGDSNDTTLQTQKNDLKRVLALLFGPVYDIGEPISDYKKRWGISAMLRLAGGGESSLNNGGSTNWGSTQASATNNNNNNQSAWGATSGNPSGNAGNSGNWSGSNVNRSVSGNPNSNQNSGPLGGQNVPGNVNKMNNPNQQSNQQSGPPTSQSSSTSQGGQNNNQWSQGMSSNPGGPGQNPSIQNNNNTVQQQQQQQSNSNSSNNQPNNQGQGSVNTSNTPASNNPSTKQQLEQLNTMREALFSQDGWGRQHVNQDTNWDVPTTPEPNSSKDGVPVWKPPVNTGTDLWEANIRNGGQPPPQQQPKTPWGHTPATNIGGTWGEDDEAADSSNMWTGAPTSSQPNTAAGQWTTGTGNQAGMWGGSNWGDPRIDHRDPRDLRSVDPREIRDPRDHRMSLDPREHIRVMDPMARDPRMTDMRGDPRGISGRLNGANADTMWGQPPGPPHHQMGHQHPSGPPTKMLNPSSINQWAAPPPKDIMPGKPSGWEEPSPPTQRRNVPNYDDGTSLWGNAAANQRTIPGSKVSHWKDLPTPNVARGGTQCPPGMPQNRMPGQPGMKPDVSGPMWGHPGAPGGRNGSWTEGPHDTGSWDDPKTPSTWNEAQLNPGTWGGPSTHKPKPMGPAGSWGDTDMDHSPSWAHPTKPILTKEVIWSSREFRYLCDLGFKKDDVELALRNREMNRDEALELLSQIRPVDQWRRHDAHSTYDPSNQATTAPAYPRFNHVAQQMSFPPGAGVASGNTTGSVGGSVASASLLKLQQQQQQAAVPLQQQQPSGNAPQPPFNQPSRTPQNQPSTQQLRMLVQQIQLAVQEGYLNHQILNQPLAPQTLILLNQLLQQIKVLQQLHQQHSVQSNMKGNGQSVLQISVQITKTKQQIANLQNQIAVQQATYMKQQQQQQQQQHPAPPSQNSEYYKSSVHDPMSALQNSFTELTMNKEPPISQPQSRLNQWKLPSLDKDGELVTNEFSRAPGTTRDGTWSTRLGESGWPDPGNTDSTDGKDWQSTGAATFTDLVPEFEPGKPWKGTQMKSIEDDPSITPGSVVRSPLSLATIKDPDAIFNLSSKTSPPPPQQPTNLDTSIPSLSNSTWTFNPPATTPSAFTSTKNTWGESAPPPTAVTSELWGAPISKVRGPPPGLGNKAAGNTSNGWTGLGTVSRSSSSWGLQSSSNAGWISTWLLLKNLTPQIDGSTLKTLCMQHGPVLDFRLFLSHGIALTKYSSRDEAVKAQGALNNCVLGNTTIFAEYPADSEVHALLQQLGHGGQQQAGATAGAGWGLRPSNKSGPPPDTWGGSSSQLWGAPPSSNSLWSNASIDNNDQQRATPSSLNSYLPGDLLGGESM